MSAELGHYTLILAFGLAVLQTAFQACAAWRDDVALYRTGAINAALQGVCVAFAMVTLIVASVNTDVSLALIYENTHSAMPLLYRITGVWGNHEGSFLLWILILAGYGAAFAFFHQDYSPLAAVARSVLGALNVLFLAFLLFASNPFSRLDVALAEGRELNPLLQDIGLAIHPPLLYLGYVGFAVSFALALAGLATGRVDAALARLMRPWTLFAWVFLTLGIAMGSYWAYYELGWGGFWFWDPVENASLMPWLAGTMLIHSVLVMEKRGALQRWVVLLAIFTFSFSLLGTFLVRSGLLTSVHAFALDPARGLVLLLLLLAVVGGGLVLYAWRAPGLVTGPPLRLASREGALALNNVFLSSALSAVCVGTLYPLVLDVLQLKKISVGAPYFNLTVAVSFVPLCLVLPFGPLLAWKKANLKGALHRVLPLGLTCMLLPLLAYYADLSRSVVALAGLALASFVILGSMGELSMRLTSLPFEVRRLRRLPLSTYATALGHMGLGLSLLGIVAATAFEEVKLQALKPGEAVRLAGYEIVFEGVQPLHAPNFTQQTAHCTVRQGGRTLALLDPSKRFYPARAMPTTEAGLWRHGLSQMYITFVEQQGGQAVLRFAHKPLVLLIWLGAVAMACGGTLALMHVLKRKGRL